MEKNYALKKTSWSLKATLHCIRSRHLMDTLIKIEGFLFDTLKLFSARTHRFMALPVGVLTIVCHISVFYTIFKVLHCAVVNFKGTVYNRKYPETYNFPY